MNLKKSKKATAFVMAGMMLCSGTNVLAVRAEQPVPYGMEVRAAERYESSLPVVYIDTENHAPIVSKDYYLNGTIEMQGNDRFNSDTTTLYTGALEIKGRGNSTWGMPKKPYKLKLDKKTDIFGYGKSKHWVLLANYSDPSLMRNTVAYDLSGRMGMPHMETTWVDVVLNGKYAGNYQFCEQIRIDKKRVNIFDWESLAGDAAEAIADAEGIEDAKALEDAMVENLSWVTSKQVAFEGKTYQVDDYVEIPDYNGGYLLELDQYYDEVSKFHTASGQPIMFNSPEFANTNQTMMNYVKDYIQAFEDAVQSADYTASYQGEKKHYSELFDFDALVDYWVMNELFFNEEFNKKSTYLYKDIDGLFKMGPMWDMDYSSGGMGETWITNEWATKHYSMGSQSKMWYKYLINDPYFVVKAQERYWDIRNSYVEDIVKDGGTIDTHKAYLQKSGETNEAVWASKGSFDNGVKRFKDWMNTHLLWMDQQMDTEASVFNSLGSYKMSEMSLTMSDDNGNILPEDTVSENAKADYLAEDGRDQKLHIETKDTNAVKAAVYVNGKCTEEAALSGGKTEVVISAEALTAEAGKKDVVEVKILNRNNAIIGSNYVSVLEKEKEDRVIGMELVKPEKMEYTEGEAFDPAGLTVYAVKESGEKTDVTAEAVVSGFTGAVGENIITVSYGGYTETFVVTVKEEVKDTDFVVTANGEEAARGPYNTRVVVEAPKAPAGQKFAGWREAGTETILSTEEVYTFYLARSIELEAVYAEESAEVQEVLEALMTCVSVTKAADGKYDMKFVGQLVIPKGYRLTDAGLAWSSKDGVELSLGNAAAKATHITKISNTNQFSVTIKGVPEERFVRGKIFAAVEKADVQKTIYSAEQKAFAVK